MLIEAYTAALFPEPYRVLGRVLKPLTIGHGLLLSRVNSPFTPFGARPDRVGAGDILTAVNVCARRWEAGYGMLTSRSWSWTQRAWGLRVCHLPGSEARLHNAANLLARYVTESCQGPRSWVKPEAARSNAPVLITLKTALQEWLGSTPEIALSTPIAVALHELSVYGERHGALDLVSDEEQAALEQLNGGQDRQEFGA